MAEIIINISEDEADPLLRLIEDLRETLNCEIEIKQIYRIQTDTPEVIAILQKMPSLVSTIETRERKEPPKRTNKTGRGGYKIRGNKYYKILDGPHQGKEITAGPLSLMIRKGSILPGTMFDHPDKGRLILTESKELVMNGNLSIEEINQLKAKYSQVTI